MTRYIDLHTLEESASVVDHGKGELVIQFPLSLWEAYKASISSEIPVKTQAESLLELLTEWETEPDDKSSEWWEEFHKFLSENKTPYTR